MPDEAVKIWSGLSWLLVAMIPAGIGGGILQPAINSLLTKRADSNETGGILGISAAFLSGANAFAPVIGGALFQAFNASTPFWLWAAIMAILLVFAWKYIQPGREEEAPRGLARGGAAAD